MSLESNTIDISGRLRSLLSMIRHTTSSQEPINTLEREKSNILSAVFEIQADIKNIINPSSQRIVDVSIMRVYESLDTIISFMVKFPSHVDEVDYEYLDEAMDDISRFLNRLPAGLHSLGLSFQRRKTTRHSHKTKRSVKKSKARYSMRHYVNRKLVETRKPRKSVKRSRKVKKSVKRSRKVKKSVKRSTRPRKSRESKMERICKSAKWYQKNFGGAYTSSWRDLDTGRWYRFRGVEEAQHFTACRMSIKKMVSKSPRVQETKRR